MLNKEQEKIYRLLLKDTFERFITGSTTIDKTLGAKSTAIMIFVPDNPFEINHVISNFPPALQRKVLLIAIDALDLANQDSLTKQ